MYRFWSKVFPLLCIGVLFTNTLSAQKLSASHVSGSWLAYEKGLDAVIVKLYQKNDKLYGVITHTFGEIPQRCSGCRGSKHNRRIIGMHLLKGLIWQQRKWRGKVLYPAEDRWYPCTLWRKGSRLIVKVQYGGRQKTLYIKRYRL